MRLSTKRFCMFVIGILILTLGIALTILSEMGTSPFDALLVGLFHTIGLTVGSWEIIIGLIMIFSNALIQKQRPEYLALLTAFITGAGIDFWLFILDQWVQPISYVSQIAVLLLGMVIMGIGTATYLKSDFAPIPLDRMMLILRQMTGMTITVSRTMINVALVLLALLFQGPVGIGTLLIVAFSGVLVHLFMNVLERLEQSKQLNAVQDTVQRESVSG
ncbi:YitT family protein [Bacillus sp. YIM B00319]|uniref:YczE/YyaS/YitT family protein n=1 Tax=Caldalkalibacillus salinus TaxID=2803787 RepID=UPI001920D2C0